jgi:glucosamine-6-phosphate deaminase
MRLIPLNNGTAVAHWSARHIANSINKFAPTAARLFLLGLPTGGTPLLTYKRLIEL